METSEVQTSTPSEAASAKSSFMVVPLAQGPGAAEVYSHFLTASLDGEPGFELVHRSVFVPLDLENPFGAQQLGSPRDLRERDHFERVQRDQGIPLSAYGFFPERFVLVVVADGLGEFPGVWRPSGSACESMASTAPHL